jgi:uncharacterized protein YqeY
MSELKQTIVSDMKTMMKAKEAQSLVTIRMLLAAIKQKEVDERIELTDADVITIVQKMLKQRKDSIQQFSDAGRDDLVKKEQAEVEIISKYMPEQLDEAEITSIVEAVISETGADSMKDMGKLMGVLKPKLDGKADMSFVNQIIRKKLS